MNAIFRFRFPVAGSRISRTMAQWLGERSRIWPFIVFPFGCGERNHIGTCPSKTPYEIGHRWLRQLEERITRLTSANLCAAGAMRETLQLESGIKIIRHNIEGHFVRFAVRHRPKGEAARIFIGDVSPVPDVPIRFILAESVLF
jgi:hypothetical protein